MISCKQTNKVAEQNNQSRQHWIISEELGEMLSLHNLEGAILIYDPQANVYHTNDTFWVKKGYLPASTYKIPHSLIALETELVKDQNFISKYDGEPRAFEIWNQDLTFKKAFQYSCVPCYQAIAVEVGVNRMNKYVSKLEYGEMAIDSSNLTSFWLVGESKISPLQQINLLQRLYSEELPIQKRNIHIVKDMMKEKERNGYQWSGKTGMVVLENTNQTWYIGFIEKDDNVYYFANHFQPTAIMETRELMRLRKVLSYQAFESLVSKLN